LIDLPPQPPTVSVESISRALTECGLKAQDFTVEYAKDLQGYRISIHPLAAASTERLQCIWHATWFQFIQFSDDKLQSEYNALTRARFAPLAPPSAREQLSRSGRLAGLPRREDFEDVAQFAMALEVHCGFEPHEALEVSGGTIALQPQFATVGRGPFDRQSCLLATLEVSAGVRFGFVGRERHAESPE
jgi:hypothetical protein